MYFNTFFWSNRLIPFPLIVSHKRVPDFSWFSTYSLYGPLCSISFFNFCLHSGALTSLSLSLAWVKAKGGQSRGGESSHYQNWHSQFFVKHLVLNSWPKGGSTSISIFDADLAYFPFKHKILHIILHTKPPIVMFLSSKTSIKKFPSGFFKPKFNFYEVKQLVTLYSK